MRKNEKTSAKCISENCDTMIRGKHNGTRIYASPEGLVLLPGDRFILNPDRLDSIKTDHDTLMESENPRLREMVSVLEDYAAKGTVFSVEKHDPDLRMCSDCVFLDLCNSIGPESDKLIPLCTVTLEDGGSIDVSYKIYEDRGNRVPSSANSRKMRR